MRRKLETQLLAERDDGVEPSLAELVVREPFQLELQLGVVPLLIVGHAEPLDAHGKHPVHTALHLLTRLAARLAQPAHPHFAMPQVEVLFQPHLDQRALQRAVGRVAVHVAEQGDSGAIE